MKKFQTLTSVVTPLPMKDVDTDMILPAQFLTSVSKEGWGDNLFRRLREQDSSFPLNESKYVGSQILLSDSNFGCGSSREHAVWALTQYGFRVVIAKSFADIFSGNSGKNGLLLVTLPEGDVDSLLKRAANEILSITVNLEEQKIIFPEEKELTFEYDAFRKHCMLNGLDDIDYIRSAQSDIESFRKSQETVRFCSTLGAVS